MKKLLIFCLLIFATGCYAATKQEVLAKIATKKTELTQTPNLFSDAFNRELLTTWFLPLDAAQWHLDEYAPDDKTLKPMMTDVVNNYNDMKSAIRATYFSLFAPGAQFDTDKLAASKKKFRTIIQQMRKVKDTLEKTQFDDVVRSDARDVVDAVANYVHILAEKALQDLTQRAVAR